MAEYKYLDKDGLIYYHSKIKTALGTKANSADLATVATSGSYNDLSNKPTIPTVNNATLTIQKNSSNVASFTANASSNVTANITVPTKTGDLTNNSDFQTGTQVQTAIDNALKDITGIKFEIVETLPATGVTGTIYLVAHSHGTQDIYDEYIWLSGTSTYEKIGSTDVDLSGYVKTTDLVYITNAEIDTIVA